MVSAIVLSLLVLQGVPQATQPPAEEPWPPPGVHVSDKDIAAPRVIKETKPHYTSAAMDAGIQGVVWLQAIVEADGTVSRARVKKSLDAEHGLDDAAIAAVKQWRFAPARRKADGVALPVMVEIEMSYALARKR
jgi:protein TonB